MDQQKMIDDLTERGIKVRDELVELEKKFNTKKEEFLKIQGALEALYELDKESSSNVTE
jgi:hypothetical protein